jgi:putative Holliday junction resolvase
MRFMALDVGDKRIGIALSDEGGLIASPRDTLQREGLETDIDRLIEMARNEEVGEILVGMPISMDGTEGPQAKKVRKFIHALSERSEMPVVPWDERLTTVAAERALLEGNVSRGKRRKVIDKVAAAYMLQGYLDYRSERQAEERREA